jgi:O-antigen/teichoic acid export membrane protein
MGKSLSLFRNTAYLTSAFIIQKVLAFLYFTFLARYLGVELIGQYSFALAYTTMFAVFIDLGTTPALTRDISQERNHLSTALNSILSLKFILGVFTYGLVFLVAYLLGYEASTIKLLALSGVVMVIDSLVLTLYGALRGLKNLAYEAMGVVFQQFLVLSLGAFIVYFLNGGVMELLSVFIFASISHLAYILYMLKTKYRYRFSFKIHRNFIRKFLPLVLPFALAAIFTRVYTYIDSFLLKSLLGFGAVGLYSAAYKFPMALQFVPVAFAASIFPEMSSLNATDKERLRDIFVKSMRYLFIVSFAVTGGVYAISHGIIVSFYSAEFIEAVPLLQILMAGALFMYINFPIGSALGAVHQQGKDTTIIGLTMVLNIALNVILIPQIGVVGAAYAFLAAHAFRFFASLIIIRKYIDFILSEVMGHFVLGLLSAGLMILAVNYASEYMHWALTIPVGAVVYVVVGWLSGFISDKDIEPALVKVRNRM